MKVDKHGLSTLPIQYPYAIKSLSEHQFLKFLPHILRQTHC